MPGPDARKGFAPKLNPNLSLRRDRASGQCPLDGIESRVRRQLLQPKGRFPLTGLDLRPGKLMPVNEDVGGLKGCSVRIQSVAVFKVSFHLEIELLGKITGQIDSCTAQTKPVL